MTRFSKQGDKVNGSSGETITLLIGGILYKGTSISDCYRQADEDENRREHRLAMREEKRDKMKYANKPRGIRHG